jgi:hypothetical protein
MQQVLNVLVIHLTTSPAASDFLFLPCGVAGKALFVLLPPPPPPLLLLLLLSNDQF